MQSGEGDARSEIAIAALDHLVADGAGCGGGRRLYERVLGMRRTIFDGDRVALHFGGQKINLHQADAPIPPRADAPRPGSADICLLTRQNIRRISAALAGHRVEIEAGPVEQHGARGRITSVYVRDPDRNLIEIAGYGESL